MAITLVYGQKNDLQKYQLEGKVKTIISDTYTLVMKFGELTKGEHRPGSSYAFTFDEKGNIVVRRNYNENKFEYKYISYQYNDDGNIEVDNEHIEKTQIISKAKYTYTGNKVVIDRYRENGNFYQKIVKVYSDEGNLLSEIVYDSYGDPIEKDIRTYKNGLLVKKETFEHTELYKRGKGIEAEVSYIYDEKGNVVKEKGFEMALGLKIDIVTEYTYTFDEQGNWTERTGNTRLFSNLLGKEEERTITERKITYYEN